MEIGGLDRSIQQQHFDKVHFHFTGKQGLGSEHAFAQSSHPWWRVADTVNGGNFNMQIGWPELARTVAGVAATLPPDRRAHMGIIAGDEDEAGAVNRYGAAYSLPRAISGMKSNWLRGYGDPAPHTLIAVGMDSKFLLPHFTSCHRAARLGNPYGVTNDSIGRYSDVYICGPPIAGWPEFWKNFQYFG